MTETLALQSLAQAAVRAPSGDCLPSWRFVVDTTARTISFFHDESPSR